MVELPSESAIKTFASEQLIDERHRIAPGKQLWTRPRLDDLSFFANQTTSGASIELAQQSGETSFHSAGEAFPETFN